MAYDMYKGGDGKKKARHMKSNHPMNTPADGVKTNMKAASRTVNITGPAPRPKRPAKARAAYRGQQGMYSSD